MSELASFLRWRVKHLRYLTRWYYIAKRIKYVTVNPNAQNISVSSIYKEFKSKSYIKLKTKSLPEIDISEFRGRQGKQAFVDVGEEYWNLLKPLCLEILSDEETSDCIIKYLDGKPWLWNIALNYSDAKEGYTDSQLWHFDYGDFKQIHLMVYFSEVDTKSGAFTFLNKEFSSRIQRSSTVIERLTDAELKERYDIETAAESIRLTGKLGDAFMVDPGMLLHQGARCEKPRLVAFITLTTSTPMTLGRNILSQERREELFEDYEKSSNNLKFSRSFFT